MTPNKLLELVKNRFVTLLHDNPDKLNSLLTQAIGVYQDRTGHQASISIKEPETEIPEDYLHKISCKDQYGTYVEACADIINGVLLVGRVRKNQYPLTLVYFAKLQNVDFDTFELPPQSISLISDYLHILISIPNNARETRIAVANSFDVSHITPESELNTRKAELEQKMSDQFMLPPSSIR